MTSRISFAHIAKFKLRELEEHFFALWHEFVQRNIFSVPKKDSVFIFSCA